MRVKDMLLRIVRLAFLYLGTSLFKLKERKYSDLAVLVHKIKVKIREIRYGRGLKVHQHARF